jgi:hypothetical protein
MTGEAAKTGAAAGTRAAGSDVAGRPGSSEAAGRPEDPAVDAWRGLLVAHSRLVPAVEADLRAAGQVPLSWYDVLLELNAAPDRRLRMSELGQRVVLSRTRVSRIMVQLRRSHRRGPGRAAARVAGLPGSHPPASGGRAERAAVP